MLRAASTLVRARPRAQVTGWPEARAVRASQAAGTAAWLLTPVSIAALVLAGPASVTALLLAGPASIAALLSAGPASIAALLLAGPASIPIRLRTMTARRAMSRVPAFRAGREGLRRIVVPGHVLVAATSRAAAGICCVRRAGVRRAGLIRARPR
ncbi:MAG TPA: hypothetical protein VGG35_18600 [Streptosporangiaceae bacterium]